MAGDDVVIHNYTTTFEGSFITFTCEDGLFPNVIITANCTGEGHWSTDPAHTCVPTQLALPLVLLLIQITLMLSTLSLPLSRILKKVQAVK